MRMRKGRRTFFVFALLLLLSVNWYAVLQNAQAEQSIHAFLSGENTTQVGQPFNLTFGLRGVSQNIFAQDVTLTYDSEQLDFIGSESMKERFSIVGQSETPGRVRIIAVMQGADYAVNRDSDLLTLRWQAKPLVNPAAATVSITNLVVSNGEGTEIKGGDVSYTIQITMGNKAGLLALIANAQTQYDTAVEGTVIGQYPAGSKAALQAAIGQAKIVADHPAATQQQIQKAATDLDAALRIFIASIIKSLSGDLNGDNRFTIGDLGIAAAAYGKTSADQDWAKFQKADVNHNVEVDIDDLAYIARAILNAGTGTPNKPVWSVEKQLNVLNVTSSGLTLTWSGAADPADVTGYKVYQD
ncbi:cohesin domain-containing protein, partial [Paenibacillus sp. TAF58]